MEFQTQYYAAAKLGTLLTVEARNRWEAKYCRYDQLKLRRQQLEAQLQLEPAIDDLAIGGKSDRSGTASSCSVMEAQVTSEYTSDDDEMESWRWDCVSSDGDHSWVED